MKKGTLRALGAEWPTGEEKGYMAGFLYCCLYCAPPSKKGGKDCPTTWCISLLPQNVKVIHGSGPVFWYPVPCSGV